jgi:AraC-like DNA-binding protein
MNHVALDLRTSGREDAALQASVSGVLVRGLLEVVQGRGVPIHEFLRKTEPEFLSDLASRRISLDEYQGLLERAIQLTQDPALALQCGLLASESSFGLMCPLVAHAQSLRHGLALISQFTALIGDQLRVELRERADVAQLQCTLHPAIGRPMTEQIVAGLVRALRAFGCRGDDIRAVCFKHKHPAHYRAYAAVFGGAEKFAQPFTGIEFSSSALDRPHMLWQPDLHALMRAEAERAIEQLSRPHTFKERVCALLHNHRDRQPPDMIAAARDLGISVRSLRRHLELEGTSYRELSQTMLFESACSMLRNPDLTLQAIAHALGFSSAASFHRAFTRWSTLTPREFRERRTRPPATLTHSDFFIGTLRD